MLPFEPESIASLAARYADAVSYVVDVPKLAEIYPDDVPSKQRRHVFDTDHGIRFIISRDSITGKTDGDLHVSVSFIVKQIKFDPEIVHAIEAYVKQKNNKPLVDIISTIFHGISGRTLPPLALISPAGILHFMNISALKDS